MKVIYLKNPTFFSFQFIDQDLKRIGCNDNV